MTSPFQQQQQQEQPDFHSLISELRAEVQLLRTQQQQYQTMRPKPSLPDPERFTGQTHKFDTWLPSIRAKLRVDGPAIGDTVAQFYYVYLNLDSHVQAMVLPQLGQAEEEQLWDYTTILDQLTRVYDNPNKVQEAEDKLYSLRQGTDSLAAYVAKFERVLYEARGQSWPDANKISSFRNGLNGILRTRLSQQLNLPRTYADFIRTVQQLSGKAGSNYSAPHSSSTALPNPNTTHHHSDPMDIGAINAIVPVVNRARSISPKQREQYRQTGRCVRCGSSQHWVASCPSAPTKTVPRGRIANMKVPRPTPVPRDWDESSEVSEDDLSDCFT